MSEDFSNSPDAEWTLDDHLRFGVEAIQEIKEDDRAQVAQPVCHHFFAETDNEEEYLRQISGERFEHLDPIFEAIGLGFASDRLEAWETVIPTLDWLQLRIPQMLQIASESGLSEYQGWTFEPRLGPAIGASTVNVINNRSGMTQ